MIARHRQDYYAGVARLATWFSWSEAEIFTLPMRRFCHYLTLTMKQE